ncbi:nuclear transport factor 2 family protein [Paeniglutamicibacter sp. ORCA_105]|uniref:nuclear transport factor 2 family protein n=1 Tax=Paeniglutamicibacter sp. ORCA_105 TaxID=3377336 RepID=UPI003895670D
MTETMGTTTAVADGTGFLADLEALRRLTHEYCRAVDTSRIEDVADLFAADAEWDATEFGMEVLRGRDAIREFFAGLVENTEHRCHLALNHMINIDGDAASATVYLHAMVVMADGRRDESVGYYTDDYVRTAQGWKFRRRAAHPLLAPPPPPV